MLPMYYFLCAASHQDKHIYSTLNLQQADGGLQLFLVWLRKKSSASLFVSPLVTLASFSVMNRSIHMRSTTNSPAKYI